jgi:anti-anti-sigma regulatory factor
MLMLVATHTVEHARSLEIESDVLDLGRAGRHGRMVVTGLIGGENDLDFAIAVEQLVHAGLTDLVVDVVSAEFRDAASLRLLARLRDGIEHDGGRVVIDGLGSAATRVLEATSTLDAIRTH